MGYYIQVPQNQNKAAQLVNLYGAETLREKITFSKIPEDKALICVVQNGMFDAAGYCFDEQEFMSFAAPDGRPRTWLLMGKELVHSLTGFQGE